ncbi:hypothetical protein ACSSS7_003987 [Eimeria intestinalis]
MTKQSGSNPPSAGFDQFTTVRLIVDALMVLLVSCHCGWGAMGGHMGLLFHSGWFSKTVWSSIFGIVALDKYAKWCYGIPDYHNYNLTCWPYALERANLRRYGIDPDSVDLTGESS